MTISLFVNRMTDSNKLNKGGYLCGQCLSYTGLGILTILWYCLVACFIACGAVLLVIWIIICIVGIITLPPLPIWMILVLVNGGVLCSSSTTFTWCGWAYAFLFSWGVIFTIGCIAIILIGPPLLCYLSGFLIKYMCETNEQQTQFENDYC